MELACKTNGTGKIPIDTLSTHFIPPFESNTWESHSLRLPKMCTAEGQLPFLAAIDLSSYTSAASLPESALYVGGLFATVGAETLDTAFQLLRDTVGQYEVCLEVTNVQKQDHVVDLLDAGAAKVFMSEEQASGFNSIPSIDKTRIVCRLDDGTNEGEEMQMYGPSGIYLPHQNTSSSSQNGAMQSGYSNSPPAVYVSMEGISENEAIEIMSKKSQIPIIPAKHLILDADAVPGLVRVAPLLLARLTSDRPDGLFTTLVVDTQGIALGLVYSSADSLAESLRSGRGVYHSRKRGLWRKGDTSGDWQELVRIDLDCDGDCSRFVVRQQGDGFCHLKRATCFGEYRGLARLQKTLQSRKRSAPEGSYTARLFNDRNMLNAKILEEANELCEAEGKEDIAAEAADVLYFALTKCVANGVSLEDVERRLDARSFKVKRRKGDAKKQYAEKFGVVNGTASATVEAPKVIRQEDNKSTQEAEPVNGHTQERIRMRRYVTSQSSPSTIQKALQRPSQRSSEQVVAAVTPIIQDIRTRGDAALLEYTHRFEKATSLTTPVLKAPFPPELMQLDQETIDAIDTSYENIRTFHAAQQESKPLEVETMPGVVCSRFSRPIERVGLYVPGGTAVLPSTALMLGAPAQVAGCKTIVIASPPRADGSISPAVVYVAHKVGAESIVLAGGAQAIAAMAYGTQSVAKVDKILGPGNQFVTAAKSIVSCDVGASVAIDMPAGPSEVLVIADESADPRFVASDLLSQAEHGVDSQVVCIAVGLSEEGVQAVEDELHRQAMALPRVDMVRGAISHSVMLVVETLEEAMDLSNAYAPEHLILQLSSEGLLPARDMVQNAGSIFLGKWTPESVGDYSAGVNHSLPTYGYARMYSGVNLGSYVKHITSSQLTEEGLKNVGGAVMKMAEVEELEAHRRAVSLRLDAMQTS